MAFDQKPEPVTVWTIAIGVMLGVLFADAIKFSATLIYAKVQLASFMDDMKKQQEQEAQNNRARREIEEAAKAKAQQARLTAIQQADAAQRQAAEAKQRKDAAWAEYFTPAPICSDPPDPATFTKCANDHLKAKTKFEATYQP